MSQRPEHDVYDGHADYRRELEPRSSASMLLSLLRGILAFGVGVAIMRLVWRLFSPELAATMYFGGMISMFTGLGSAVAAYHGLNGWDWTPQRSAGARDVVAAAFVVVALVIPMTVASYRKDAREMQRQVEERDAQRARQDEEAGRKAEAMERLRLMERVSAPGVVPPYFEVQDHGALVFVTYRGGSATQISLARVRPDTGAPGGWKGCALWTTGYTDQGGPYHVHRIASGKTLSFSMYDGCVAEFLDAPLEFRVGDPLGSDQFADSDWWSESAFGSPDGRNKETFARLSNLDMYKSRQAELVRERLEREAAEPVPESVPAPSVPPDEVVARPVEVQREAASDSSTPDDARRIVKCRDTSGAVLFTQSHCPPGTSRVDLAPGTP